VAETYSSLGLEEILTDVSTKTERKDNTRDLSVGGR